MALSVGDAPKPAANGVGTHADAGSGEGGGEAEGGTPDIAKLVSETVNAVVSKAFEGYTGKINGEQAKFRKQLEALTKPAGEQTPKPASEAPKAVDHEAMMGMVEQIAEIRAGLPTETREDLKADTDGLSYAEKLRIYQAAQKAHDRAMASAKAATEAGGEKPDQQGASTPKRSPARAATSAARESVQHPKTVAEFLRIAKTDPKRKAALDADDSFDPSSLPQF